MNPYKTGWKESYYKYNTHAILSQMEHNNEWNNMSNMDINSYT
jgi:hypothetical protein